MTIIQRQGAVNNFVTKMSYLGYEPCRCLREIQFKSLKIKYIANICRLCVSKFNFLLGTEISNLGCSFSRG